MNKKMIYALIFSIVFVTTNNYAVIVLPPSDSMGAAFGRGIGSGISQAIDDIYRQQEIERRANAEMKLQEQRHKQRMQELAEERKLCQEAHQLRMKEQQANKVHAK